MFRGLLIKESLKDLSVLGSLIITKEEQWDVENATADQSPVWNVVWFEVADDAIDTTAKTLGDALYEGKWYLDLSSDSEKVVVFPGKVFRYQKGDEAVRLEAQEFGRAIGIPEDQLDWAE